jgi:hypothetical protein
MRFELAAFLWLRAVDGGLVPAPEVDRAWRFLLVDTRGYERICRVLARDAPSLTIHRDGVHARFDELIAADDLVAVTRDAQAAVAAYARTRAVYCDVFGVWPRLAIWPRALRPASDAGVDVTYDAACTLVPVVGTALEALERDEHEDGEYHNDEDDHCPDDDDENATEDEEESSDANVARTIAEILASAPSAGAEAGRGAAAEAGGVPRSGSAKRPLEADPDDPDDTVSATTVLAAAPATIAASTAASTMTPATTPARAAGGSGGDCGSGSGRPAKLRRLACPVLRIVERTDTCPVPAGTPDAMCLCVRTPGGASWLFKDVDPRVTTIRHLKKALGDYFFNGDAKGVHPPREYTRLLVRHAKPVCEHKELDTTLAALGVHPGQVISLVDSRRTWGTGWC